MSLYSHTLNPQSVAVSLLSPHTGWQDYQDGVRRIPTACITVEDAELMWRLALRGQKVVVRLTMGAKTLPDADSFNTVAEIKGWQHPDQVKTMPPPSNQPPSQTYLLLPDWLLCLSSPFSSQVPKVSGKNSLPLEVDGPLYGAALFLSSKSHS